MKQKVLAYYLLTKPGIIRGNALTAVGAFLLASQTFVNVIVLAVMLLGLSLIIASGCVLNNILDTKIDSKMARTKKRALVTGVISKRSALVFAIFLGSAGTVILLLTNLLTLFIALFGLFMYVAVYGIAKRKTWLGTAVGSIPGAVPPVVGYTAVTNSLDATAILLFVILVLWQMPHFYAIAIFRSSDYKAASIPVLPLVKGIATTKRQILLFVGTFIVASALLAFAGPAGYAYLTVMLIGGFWWLWIGIKNINRDDDVVWAKKMFGASLLILLLFSFMISVDAFLP